MRYVLCCRRRWLGSTHGVGAQEVGSAVGTCAGQDRLLDAAALRAWAHAAVSDLITHIDEINRLNVFPVADADTGANMLFTMRSALAEANAGAEGGRRARRRRPGRVRLVDGRA